MITPRPVMQIGLGAWIIADGNYRGFAVGETVRFALQYFPWSIRRCEPGPKMYGHRGDGLHTVRGRRVFTWDGVGVIDAGVLAYRTVSKRDEHADDGWFEGQIYLGVDPFEYAQTLCHRAWMPAMTYTWRIQEIHRVTTPRVNREGVWPYDEARRSSEAIFEIDDANLHGSDFVLTCELLPFPPTKGARP